MCGHVICHRIKESDNKNDNKCEIPTLENNATPTDTPTEGRKDRLTDKPCCNCKFGSGQNLRLFLSFKSSLSLLFNN